MNAPDTSQQAGLRARPSSSALALWLALGGVAMLGTGSWIGARAVLRLGPLMAGGVLVAALGAGALLAAALIALLVPAHVDDEAQILALHLDSVGRGDLTRAAGDIASSSVLAPVASAFTRAIHQLRSALGPARSAAREASVRADDFVTQCSAAHVSAQRTAEQGAHVAEQAARGAESTTRCLEGMHELLTGVRELESRYRAMTDGATTMADRSRRAVHDLAQSGEALDDLTQRFGTATTHLAELGKAVEEVREFVTLVRKMARQSKLLSLNAAMEAARAGEQGSGFGVVAGEVRRLAKSSSEAADRTEKLLQELVGGVELAYEGARESLALARAGKVSLDQSREELESLREQVPGVYNLSELPAAQSAALAAHVEQLQAEFTGLAQAAKDARLAGSAQVARLQDLSAAAHSLSRSAARSASALQHLRLEGPEAGSSANPAATTEAVAAYGT